MENSERSLYILEIPEYVEAEKTKFRFKDHFISAWKLLKMTVAIFVLLVPALFRGIFRIVFPPKPKSIKGKLALVTGGASGIGRAIAFELAKEGCNLAICDIDLRIALKTSNEIEEKYKIIAVAFKVDIADQQAVQELKREVESKIGPVDILVNNAGLLCHNISLREGSSEDIQRIINVNLSSHFWTLRTFFEGMVERKQGHIVAIGSMAGKFTIPFTVAYSATKFGVTGLMSALNDEICAFGLDDDIKTSIAFPTFVNTRKELARELEKSGVPRLNPNYVAHMIVKGILRNQRLIFIPKSAKFYSLVSLLPDNIIKYVKNNMFNIKVIAKERTEIFKRKS